MSHFQSDSVIQILITKIEELIGRYREKIFAIKDVQKLKDKYYLQRTKSFHALELGLTLNKKQSSPFKLSSIPLSLSNLTRTNSYPKSVNIIEQQTQRIIFKELRNIKRSLHESANDIEYLFQSHISHFPNFSIDLYQREKYINILVNDPFLNYLLNSNKDSKLIEIINEITKDKNIKQATDFITLKHCLPEDFGESCSQCESEEIKIEQQNWIHDNKHYNINNINFNILGKNKTPKIQDTYTSSDSSSSTSIQTISTTTNFKDKKRENCFDMKNNAKDVKTPKDMGLDDWVNYINNNEEKKAAKKKKKKRKKNNNKGSDDNTNTNNNIQSDNGKIINCEDETENEILSFKELINKYSNHIIYIQKIKPNFSKDWCFDISSFKND